jgi:hypothetical protein
LNFFEPGTFTYGLTVVDSRGKVVTDNIQIVISERGLPPTEGIVAPKPGGIAPPQEEGGGLLPGTTTPAANDTGGNDTGGGVTEQPLTVEIVPNATEGIAPAAIAFDSKVTGGTAPYTYQWRALGVILEAEFRNAAGFVKELPYPNSFYFILNVTDSKGQTASDTVAIYIKEQPSEGGGGLLPGIAPGEEEEQQPQAPPTVPEEGEPTTGSGEEEDTGGAPPPDDTGEEGEGTPPSTTTEEEPTTPPEGGG